MNVAAVELCNGQGWLPSPDSDGHGFLPCHGCAACRPPVRKPLPPLKPRVQLVTESPPPVDSNRAAKSGGRSKGNDLYLTPDGFLAVLSKLGEIELDPAGSEAGSFVWPAREYRLDRGEDGLILPWKVKLGALCYCNPPYSKSRKWIEKANAEHVKHMSEIVMLIAARTDTIAFQANRAKCVCFLAGRLTFIDPATKLPPVDKKGKPCGAMFPSAVLYYGVREKRFREIFEPLGKVVRWY